MAFWSLVGAVEKRPMLFHSDSCTAIGWLHVAARHGSRMEIDAGGQTRTAWVNTESSVGGVVEPVAHFYLGTATEVDELRFPLPDGGLLKLADTVQAQRRITVH